MDLLPVAMLAAGLASGLHCVAMCGGIVTAFDAGGKRVIPLREQAVWRRRIAFNAGRITTYSAAGAAVGAVGAAAYAADLLPAQQSLQVATNLLLVFVGLHLAGAGGLLSRIEALGLPLWRRLQPLAARLLKARTEPRPSAREFARSYLAGLAWGGLPCAMVYAALAAAALAGGPAQGALGMAAFGLGTLPFLLAAGWLAARLRAWRAAAGALLIGFGAFGLAHAEGLADTVRRGLLCF